MKTKYLGFKTNDVVQLNESIISEGHYFDKGQTFTIFGFPVKVISAINKHQYFVYGKYSHYIIRCEITQICKL